MAANQRKKVCLFGGENSGWALDTDLELTQRGLFELQDFLELVPLNEAEIIHSVWELPLLRIPFRCLQGKRIVCHVNNKITRILEHPYMLQAFDIVGLWIAFSKEAEHDLNSIDLQSAYLPQTVDTEIFSPLDDKIKHRLRKKYRLPPDRFVISSFMRDSDGQDLSTAKPQKGTDLFFQIVRNLYRSGKPIHVLLAGPRRHFLRNRLAENGIPYTFVGEIVRGEDHPKNILPQQTINHLYNVSDLHLITSRWEGGPRAILESSATKTPVLSTPVGLAPDILLKECLFDHADRALEILRHHLENHHLKDTVDQHYRKVVRDYVPSANVRRLEEIYQGIDSISPFFAKEKTTAACSKRSAFVACRSFLSKSAAFVRKRMGRESQKREGICFSLWHEFHKPPYGGGNQFMLALRNGLKKAGAKVVTNRFSDEVDVHICNSAWFDWSRFERQYQQKPFCMIHRIDGPVGWYRGTDIEEDANIHDLNRRFASATVYQSAYCLRGAISLGFEPVSPVIIPNTVDPELFHSKGKSPFDPENKIRLISTAWSDNPNKGGAFYKMLDERLDCERFSYTFVGRVQQRFTHIQHVQPQGSESLADLLRQHDIYITASRNEPCSNALLEAMACGLPALYRNEGGNPELVSFGGLPFEREGDFFEQLNRLVEHYELFQSLIWIRSIDEIAGKYIDLARELLDRDPVMTRPVEQRCH